jgi:hypothetical protein
MTEPKLRQTLNVDLGELKPLVLEAAQIQGRRPGAWVRDAIAQALQEQGSDVPAHMPRMAPNRSRDSAVVKFGGLLTTAGSAALRAKAAAEGVSQIELVERIALDDAGLSRARALDVLPAVVAQLLAVEHELRAVRAQLYEPGALGRLEKAVREVRAQAKRAAAALGEVSTTRRQVARRSRRETESG